MALVTLSDALTFLRWHQVTPITTPEGLLVNAESGYVEWKAKELGIEADDTMFNEATVFPIVAGELVNLTGIRNWLGY